ncbi:MAG: hypothetical protein IJQ73_16565 [Kiritimatiellae bacterium]|nr:hypothetical protein [Kiritimatiellia bacterium]MBQ6926251.1 hypothetical protein [Kiritimatiellia bacterium]
MKKPLTLALCAVGQMAAAVVYWQGPIDGERSWSASDNTVGGSGGSYWNTAANGSGTWQRTPVNENAHVNNGGTVVIDGTVGVVGDVQKLVLDINSNKASCVRIDAGGVLTNAIAYIGHNQGSSGSRFHVNGGEAWLGRGNGGEGFHLPSSQAWREGGSEYFATVSGGLLDVTGQFTIGAKATTTYLNRGMLTVEGGAVTSHCPVVVGTDSATSVNSGLINVTGGELAVVDGNVLSLYRNARLRQTGGRLVADALAVKRGVAEFRGGSSTVGFLKFLSDGTVVVSDEGNLTAGLDLGYDTPATNIANSLIVSNGTVRLLNAASSNAFLKPVRPFYLRMLGGTVSLADLYVGVGSSGLFCLELDGGALTCGKVSTYGQPFYLRHTGDAVANFDEFPLADDWNKNLCASNCLVDHVFTHKGLRPLAFRSSNRVFGRNSLRPQGGFQIVVTNRFALFRLQTKDKLGVLSLGSVPDETLWETFRFANSYDWGSQLRAEAAVGGSESILANATIPVDSRPNGYLPLPSVKTNSLKRMTVELGVVPMSATLEELAADMVAAGYENVAPHAGGETKLAFDVPISRLPDQSPAAAAVFDFTKPVCPDKFVEGPMSFSIRTNAVLSSIRVTLRRNSSGLTVLFK